MKVADIMSKHVDFVTVDTPISKIVLLIFGRNINGVPVVCEKKKLVGFITEKDILSKFFPSIAEYIDDPFHSSDFEKMEDKVHYIFEITADKIMSLNPVVVTADAPLLRAQSLMFTEKIGRLPVVDEKGNLIGIISQGDIFRALVGDRLLFTENEEYNDWLSKTYYAAVDVNDRLKHEMPDLLKLFSQNKVKSVVDLGCGTGDHVIELAKRGFNAVGIDRSEEMIIESQKRKKILGDQVKENAKFYCGTIEDVLPRLRQTFDAALFLGNTLSHNPHSSKEVIAKVMRHLSANGKIIFQITNFEKILKKQQRLVSFNFAKIKDDPNREYGFLQFYDLPLEHKKTILKTFAILSSDGKNRWKWSGVRNTLMAYTTKESLENILKDIGFSKINFYGGFFDGKKWDYLFRKPFEPLESDWLNVVAER